MVRKAIFAWALALTMGVSLAAPAPAAPTHDGSHDFDFNFGTWHTHIKLLTHSSTGNDAWVTYDGTVTVRRVWGGAANIEEIEANGPSHLAFVNVRLYDPDSRQWSLNGAGSGDGAFSTPAYGVFAGGRGVFYDQEAVAGHMVFVRQTFFGIASNAYDFEQAVSDDGGATWKANFRAHLTRLSR
jgi:hypothetical protein